MKSPRFARNLALLAPLLLLAALVLIWSRLDTPSPPTPAGAPSELEKISTARPAVSAQETADALRQTRFRQWLSEFQKAPKSDGQNAALITRGLALAKQRRGRMARLIRENPEQALREALRFDEYEALPESVRAMTERPFSARADYAYLPICDAPEGSPTHIAELSLPDGTVLQTYSYGQRGGIMSKRSLPVQGIALDGAAAMHDSVMRGLTPQEITTAERLFPQAAAQANGSRSFATGKTISGPPVIAIAGGQRYAFASLSEIAQVNQALAKLDELPGPNAGSSVLYAAKPADGEDGYNLSGAQFAAQQQADQWTETAKKVFIIRVDFSDDDREPFSQTDVATTLNTTVTDQIRAMSYGKTEIIGTVSANLYRLPQTAAYYANGTNGRNSQLLKDARNTFRSTRNGDDAMINIGPVSTNTYGDGGGLGAYDIVGVIFGDIGMRSGGGYYAGLAGGGDLWMQDNNSPAVYVHELGHCYGVDHAAFWQTSDGSVVGAGANEEYGDIFDIMGDGDVPEGHFHPQAKALLNWLTPSEWTDATAGGSNTYRIHRIDSQLTTGNPRGVRITKGTAGGAQYYWLGYRPAYDNIPYLARGAYLIWQRPGETRSWLVDTTPATSGEKTDAPIPLGRTYADTTAKVFITPLTVGGSGDNQYLDVRVNIGAFASNSPPTGAVITGPSSVPARSTASFSVTATDSNSDTLAYFWDTGDGGVNDNADSLDQSWTVGGSYTLTVTVSDMKGGTTTATKSIIVTDPLTTFVNRSPVDLDGDFQAVAAGGGQVVAVGSLFTGAFAGPTARSTDGVTWSTSDLGLNRHLYSLIHDGTQFVGAGTRYNFSAPAGYRGWIATSPDGRVWTERYFSGKTLYSVSHGGGVYLAAGDEGSVLRSTNGTDWSSVGISGVNSQVTFEGLAWNGTVFVLTGYTDTNGGAKVYTSPNGTTWTNRSAGAGLATWQDLRKVAWLNDRFVSSGWYSKLRTSTDNGATFTTTRTVAEETPAMAYGDGTYFAAGVNYDADEEDVDLISQDGVTWSSFNAPTADDRRGAVFYNHTFITVGDDASIWQSGELDAATGFSQWQDTHFPGGSPLAGATTDADNDGHLNIVEYAMGTDPNAAAGPVSYSTTQSGRTWLHLDVPEPARTDVTYVVQGNNTLTGTWTDLARKPGTSGWSWLGGGTSRIQFRTPADGLRPMDIGTPDSAMNQPRYFLRLSIRHP